MTSARRMAPKLERTATYVSSRPAACSARAHVRKAFAVFLLALSVPAVASTEARAARGGLFDVARRSADLQRPAFAAAREACLAVAPAPDWPTMAPVARLEATAAYGSDRSAEDFSWAVMVLSGRALAGEAASRDALRRLLLAWADADAFGATARHYDPYYALKRVLQPLTVAYTILDPALEADERARLRTWIDALVRRVDVTFGKEVDENNHRILADAVLAVWGSAIGDEALMEKAFHRYRTVLGQMREDGSLPLEARRGARALWYQRQALSSMTVIAEVARGQGIDLYSEGVPEGRSLSTLLGWLLGGVASPLLVQVYSAENHIPGPERDFRALDLSFLETRAHGRHYMAWAEASMQHGQGLSFDRLSDLFERRLSSQRPLIDEFAGGNATCFWAVP